MDVMFLLCSGEFLLKCLGWAMMVWVFFFLTLALTVLEFHGPSLVHTR